MVFLLVSFYFLVAMLYCLLGYLFCIARYLAAKFGTKLAAFFVYVFFIIAGAL